MAFFSSSLGDSGVYLRPGLKWWGARAGAAGEGPGDARRQYSMKLGTEHSRGPPSSTV